MLSKLNSTDVVANFINSTNTTSGISGGGQITLVQYICTYLDSFQNGNTSEETTDIKRIHQFVQWRTLSNETTKFERIFYTICTLMHKHWLQYPVKPLGDFML